MSLKAYFGLLAILSFKCLLTHAHFGQCPVRNVLTYNTALLDQPLAKGLPNNRLERREAIINELRRLDADVVCLQEVWIGQDVERIVRELADVYSFSFSKLHIAGPRGGHLPDQSGPNMPPCDRYSAVQFKNCLMRNKCKRKSYDNARTYSCVNYHCYSQFKLLSQECVSCIAASWQNIASVIKKCVGVGLPAINMRTINSPGLLLLSKRPLINAKYTDFHPYTKDMVERGYIDADTEDLGKLVCTHNTNTLPNYLEIELARIGAFSTYEEQGRSERDELIQVFGHSSRLVLAGDFNTGDAFGPVINQDLPHAFSHLARHFNIMPVTQCTYCWPYENIYTKSSEGIVQTIIDHVFYKGHKIVGVSRVLKPIDANLYGTFPLSDHNGVMASFSLC